jgi:CDP-paratose 2-epimerase
MECNLWGTIDLLEICRRDKCGLVFLSTSRVYSLRDLGGLPVRPSNKTFVLDQSQDRSFLGISPAGVVEDFPTTPPVSLYGATKLASETIALEYGESFDFPVLIDRCGVIAGAGQFGRSDQGIFSYWINSWLHRRPLEYIGFGGEGLQVRDCLHPSDLLDLIVRQMHDPAPISESHKLAPSTSRRVSGRVFNVGGGIQSATSLRQLSEWCHDHLGEHEVSPSTSLRRFDVPWLVLDATSASRRWAWHPQKTPPEIFSEIAAHARENPGWLNLTLG